jgi:integrase/recombinase XerD
MSPLRQELDRYLTIRRSLGYELDTSARVLRRFLALADAQGATHVTKNVVTTGSAGGLRR